MSMEADESVEAVYTDESHAVERDTLSAAERARIEKNRLRARALREARLVARVQSSGPALPRDTGGGFLPEEETARVPRVPRDAHPPAPLVDPAERPPCLHCGRAIAHSYLLDTFGHPACDDCRDDEGPHELLTRTEAKSEFLLKDCDLDLRPPALRCERRRNPHGMGRSDMRLYLRTQLAERALLVWGSEEELRQERARRLEARAAATRARTSRRLRTLRLEARSGLFAGVRAAHEHVFGAETYDSAADVYSRACTTCPHVERYEKM